MSQPAIVERTAEPQGYRLERQGGSGRWVVGCVLTTLTWGATVVALVPLFSILLLLAVQGGQHLRFTSFTELPPPPGPLAGGLGNALLGTLLMVSIAAVLSVPLGVLAAIQLAEFGRGTRMAHAVRFAAQVLTGLPSILAGVFAYGLVVVTTGTFSAWAGGVALALLMLPTVLLTAEEALKQVPRNIREAALALGATPTQMVWRVVLPAARPGIVTGVLLAVARAAGETAPLLFTALFSDYWLSGRVLEPTASLSVLIYNFSGVPFANQIDLAWTASFVLVLYVLVLNLVAHRLAPRAS